MNILGSHLGLKPKSLFDHMVQKTETLEAIAARARTLNLENQQRLAKTNVFSYLDVKNQAGTKGMKYAASKGLGVVVMEPLRGGLLSRTPPPEVATIRGEADNKKSPSEWALRWIWNHPEVTVVLSGMNEESHIEENIRIARDAHSDSLTQDEKTLVKRVARKFNQLMKAGCTGCHYCMPCPAGVNIPACFELYNVRHLFKGEKWAKLNYLAQVGGLFVEPGRASQCEECGECEKACPQDLPVAAVLKDVAAEMEEPFFDAKLWMFMKFMRFKSWQVIRSGSQSA